MRSIRLLKFGLGDPLLLQGGDEVREEVDVTDQRTSGSPEGVSRGE